MHQACRIANSVTTNPIILDGTDERQQERWVLCFDDCDWDLTHCDRTVVLGRLKQQSGWLRQVSHQAHHAKPTTASISFTRGEQLPTPCRQRTAVLPFSMRSSKCLINFNRWRCRRLRAHACLSKQAPELQPIMGACPCGHDPHDPAPVCRAPKSTQDSRQEEDESRPQSLGTARYCEHTGGM